jgi:cobyric acid synthase
MDSTSQTLDVEKLMIQKLEENKILLEEKIKELEANEEEMQVFEFPHI